MVGETVLASKVSALVSGQISVSQFQAATSPSALQNAAQQVTLPGAPSEQRKSNAVALGVGLGIGLGVPLIAGAGFAYWYLVVRKGGSGAGSGLHEGML